MENINKLQNFLKNSHEAILIHSPENRRYFTNFPSSDGYLVITKDDAVLFADSRYIEAAQKNASCKAKLVTKASIEIKEYLKEKHILKAYTERDRLTVSTADFFKTAFLPCRVTPSKRLENKINELRMIKSEAEIECIKKAQSIAEEAFDHILSFIRPGVTEKRIALELDFYMLSHGAEALSFETIAVTGKKTSMPHGVPDDTVVEIGDFVTMDFGAVYKGYHSDMTRTVAVGNVSKEQEEIYDIVFEAQKTALSVLRKGLPCSEADKAARDIIKNAGYGDYFGHGTGHGVGYFLNVHEGPNGFRWKIVAERNDSAILEEGMITSNEPGFYLEGKYGIRTENMIACVKDEKTEYGQFMRFENLTMVPIDLEAIHMPSMTDVDKARLNSYHREVYEKISPYMNDEERAWLKEVTKEV